jgi:sugar lactone lactonase YvrE
VTNRIVDPAEHGVAVACTTKQALLGEGARWDARRGELLVVDILAGRVYRGWVDDEGGLSLVRAYHVPGTVGAIAPVQGDEGWLLAAGRGFVHLSPGGSLGTLAEVAPPGTRMNDAACDPQGRFWAGTLADDHRPGGGALYRLDRDGRTELVLDGLTISNGLGWSPDGSTMYLVDSGPRVVHAFAFDPGRGTISAGRVLVTVPVEVGAPDGMTVDAAGGWRSTGVDGSTAIHPTVCCAKRLPSRPNRARPARSRAPGWTGSTSPPRPRPGATSSVAPSLLPGSSTGSIRMRPDGRRRSSVPTPPGGRR